MNAQSPTSQGGAPKRRVFLHIGAPKTGTTYLQDRLSRNTRSLARHDVHFPGRTALSTQALFHFRAALDLVGEDWGGLPGHAEGSWPAMVKRVNRKSGTVVISHEILAPAAPAAIARAKNDLMADPGTELHIVYTARDLGRQLPAAWQESVKQGRRWPFRRFLGRVQRSGHPWFFRAFDLPAVVEAWAEGLPPERVHVITVPPSGADRDLLWLRFCSTIGIDPAWAPTDAVRVNQSLGVVETEVLRKLNRRIDKADRRQNDYDQLIREHLANHEMSQRPMSPAVRLPPGLYDWVEGVAQEWIDYLSIRGVDIVGDVEELRPVRPTEGTRWVNPDKVSPKKQAQVALDALAAMTREAARRPDPDKEFLAKVRTQAKMRRES